MGGLDIPLAGVIAIGCMIAISGFVFGVIVGFALGKRKDIQVGVACWESDGEGAPIFTYKLDPKGNSQ